MTPTPEFYGREYNNRALVPDFATHFAQWAEQSSIARRRGAGTLDIAYGSSAKERLDLFTVRRKGAPLFVFIHGGYWRSMDKGDFSFIAPALVAAGINVAVINYDLCPLVTIDDIVRQNLAAFAWLYRNARRYGYDSSRIVVGGHSAGGHLGAMMLCARWANYSAGLPADLIKGALLVSGLYDLEPMVHTEFLNVDLKLDAGRALRLSPAYMPPAGHTAVITAVGGDESSEFHRQTRLLGQRWPANLRADLAMPGLNHMTVISQLAVPESPLFAAAVQLCRGRS